MDERDPRPSSTPPEARGLLDEVLRLYGDRAASAAARLLANDAVARGLQGVLATSAELRTVVQRIVRATLESLQVPTGRDFEQMYERMDDVEEQIFQVRDQLCQVSEQIRDLTTLVRARDATAASPSPRPPSPRHGPPTEPPAAPPAPKRKRAARASSRPPTAAHADD